MKLFGRMKCKDEPLLSIEAMTIQATSVELREIVKFLLHCANKIENDPEWEHEHLNDFSAAPAFAAGMIVYAARPDRFNP